MSPLVPIGPSTSQASSSFEEDSSLSSSREEEVPIDISYTRFWNSEVASQAIKSTPFDQKVWTQNVFQALQKFIHSNSDPDQMLETFLQTQGVNTTPILGNLKSSPDGKDYYSQFSQITSPEGFVSCVNLLEKDELPSFYDAIGGEEALAFLKDFFGSSNRASLLNHIRLSKISCEEVIQGCQKHLEINGEQIQFDKSDQVEFLNSLISRLEKEGDFQSKKPCYEQVEWLMVSRLYQIEEPQKEEAEALLQVPCFPILQALSSRAVEIGSAHFANESNLVPDTHHSTRINLGQRDYTVVHTVPHILKVKEQAVGSIDVCWSISGNLGVPGFHTEVRLRDLQPYPGIDVEKYGSITKLNFDFL